MANQPSGNGGEGGGTSIETQGNTNPPAINNRNNHGGRRRNNRVPQPRVPRFTGRCEGLIGHVFDVIESKQKQAEQYNRTVREVATYVNKEYKHGDDIRYVITELAEPNLDSYKPPAPTPVDEQGNFDMTEEAIWKEEIKAFVQRRNMLRRNMTTAYALVWGQCSDALQAELETNKTFSATKASSNVIALLKAIRGVSHNFQAQKNPTHSLHLSKRQLYMLNQGQDSTPDYYDRFKISVDVLEAMDGIIGSDPLLLKQQYKKKKLDPLTASVSEIKEVKEDARDEYLAIMFILGADRRRFGKYIEDLENDYLQGKDHYPKTLVAAYNVLMGWKQDPRNSGRPLVGPFNDGVQFVMDANENNEYSGRFHAGITCYNCGAEGHYANDCPKPDRRGKNKEKNEQQHQLFMSALEDGAFDNTEDLNFVFHQSSVDGGLNPYWILLDSESTCDVFCNPALLENIHESNGSL